jgi:hypothetical protein
MERKDIILLPLVAVGLAKAVGEVILRPFFEDRVYKRPPANIQHYRTPEKET